MYAYFHSKAASRYNFSIVPDDLIDLDEFVGLSSTAKLLYSRMLSRMELSRKNGWVDEYDRVYMYYKASEVAALFRTSERTARSLLDELEKYNLLEKKRDEFGKPNKLYLKDVWNEDAVIPEELFPLMRKNSAAIPEENYRTVRQDFTGHTYNIDREEIDREKYLLSHDGFAPSSDDTMDAFSLVKNFLGRADPSDDPTASF